MIIKERDSKQRDIKELISLLKLDISPKQRFLIEREIRFIKAGERGENDAAYFINFYFGESKNWAVIHDLRIEFNNYVAQIDHLLINRFLDFYVLESKNFFYPIKITTEGEFLIWHRKRGEYYSIESPIEQNERHIFLLDKVLKKLDILPKRFGLPLKPRFKSYILLSPKSKIIRPPRKSLDTSMVIKADMLKREIDKYTDQMSNFSIISSLSKLISSDTLKEVAEKISKLHRPKITDYKKKFGISKEQIRQKTNKRYLCSRCGSEVSLKVANYCLQHKGRFKGKIFCFKCQKMV